MTNSTDRILREAAGLIESDEVVRARDMLHKLHREPNQKTTESLLLLAATYEAKNDLDEATQLTEQAASLANSGTQAGQLYARAADLAYLRMPGKRKVKERIVHLLSCSVKHDSSKENIASRRKLCVTLLALQNYEQLLNHSIALKNHSEDAAQARIWAASACFFLNRKSEGSPYLAAALAQAPELNDQQLYTALTLAIEYSALDEADRILDWMQSTNRAGSYRREFGAKVARERGNNAEALKLLTRDYIQSIDHPQSRQRLLALRGKCLDAVGDYAEAHECFIEMNQIARELWGRQPDAEQLKRLEKAIPQAPPRPSNIATPPSEYIPTFLVGFPRSGTTLLESILDTNSQIQTLSETDVVSSFAREMHAKGLSYPADIAQLDTAAIESLRSNYYESQSQFIGDLTKTKVVVDKLPLNILHIPIFLTLFPTANFILALRHPADVCISCFQQDFVLNGQMIHFTDFEGCFRRYRDVFRLFEVYRERLNLEVFTVRYEDVTSDLDSVANGLFNFLGVEPEEHYRNFSRINRNRLTNTPSRGQITKPLYQSSRYRWINYAEFVRPLETIIANAASRYGYSLDESPSAPSQGASK